MKQIKRIKFLKLILVFALAINSPLFSQGNVGINTIAPHPSAALELFATDRGFLPPRLTTSQRDAISPKPAGLVIYNSSINCLQYWNSTQWIGLCNTTSPAVGATITDCTSAALNGIYRLGTAMTSGNTISLTVNVTQLGPWTASSAIVNGISFAGSGTFTSTGSQTITLTATGNPTANGTFSFLFTLNGSTCVRNITFSPPPINARIGRYAFYTIGSTDFPDFNSQLSNPANYGPTGTYNGVTGFTFGVANLDTTAGNVLKANFDIINTGYYTYANFTSTAIQRLKDYATLGGVVIVSINSNDGFLNFNTLCNAFGITGSNGIGALTFQSDSTNELSNIFGDTKGIALNGLFGAGRLQASQLPAGSKIIGNETVSGGGVAVWTVGGYGGKVIFTIDEGIFRNTNVSGTTIDNDQEKFIHNIMAYALDKARGL